MNTLTKKRGYWQGITIPSISFQWNTGHATTSLLVTNYEIILILFIFRLSLLWKKYTIISEKEVSIQPIKIKKEDKK